MKMWFLFLTLLSVFGLGLYAQDDKPVVYVEYFPRPANVEATLAEALRSKAIQGIQETNRVKLVDVASQSGLNGEEERRKAESAMGDATARTAEMKTLGANYIITGEIVSMNETERKDDKG